MAKVSFATPPPELDSDQPCHPGFHPDQLRQWQVANSPYPGNLPSPPEYFFHNDLYQQGPRTDTPQPPLYTPPLPPRPTLRHQTSTSASTSSSRGSHRGSPNTRTTQRHITTTSDTDASKDAFQDDKNADAVADDDAREEHQHTTTDITADAPPSASAGKESFQDRMYRWSTRAGVHVNRVTNKLGCEAWWPMPLDKECDKCARILRSFVKDGIYTPGSTSPYPSATSPTPDSLHYPGPKTSSSTSSNPTKRTLIKIPRSVLQNAKGLAIFTSFRTGGPQLGGAGGSGVVTIRLPDGSWSPPSGILPNNLSFGLMLGIDVYDCVCVLNTDSAVDAFTKRARVSLGGDIAMVAGPVGTAAQFDKDLGGGGGVRGIADKPVWCYVKSRGFYAGASVDGTVVIERPDANAMFYGEKGIKPSRILKGDVREWEEGRRAEDGSRMWPEGARSFMNTVREAEGR